jgi:AP endonuclease-1
LEQKKEWNVHFENYIRDLDKIKPVIWTGDLNVAPTSMGQPTPSSPTIAQSDGI